MNYIIRKMQNEESVVLTNMLYLAIFNPDNVNPLPKSIIENPGLRKYYENWGKTGDSAICAISDDKIIGVAWTRLFGKDNKGYGHISDDIPEMSIAIVPEYRGFGIGGELIIRLTDELKSAGVFKISLSVDNRSRAYKLYKRLGFKKYSEHENSVIMIKDL